MSGPRIGLGYTSTAAAAGGALFASSALTAGLTAGLSMLPSVASAIAGQFGQGRKQADIVTHAWADVTEPFLDRMYHAMADESLSAEEAKTVLYQILPQYELWWRTNVLSKITDNRVRPQAEATLSGSDAGSLGNLRRALGEYIARYLRRTPVTPPGIDKATLGPGVADPGTGGPSTGGPSTGGPDPVAPLITSPLVIPPVTLPGGGKPTTTAPAVVPVPIVTPIPSGGGNNMEFNSPQQDPSWPGLFQNIWGQVAPLVIRPKAPAPVEQDFFSAASEIPWWVYVIAGIAVYELMSKQQRGRR